MLLLMRERAPHKHLGLKILVTSADIIIHNQCSSRLLLIQVGPEKKTGTVYTSHNIWMQ